ncbi:Zn-dependent protease with chaperone function [Blastococcus colisei]|uniref:Zn-dependent protease with chaperone function n=1 Tax=Blastococcus colisei TaxID=1564162 RepID=A0A543NZQ4_9ACTN|nr:M48 family metalloprotease [Blastococcus colisei]TQN37341.1 Zn-dependent protease with chaperone function [Blastococcus colisei]
MSTATVREPRVDVLAYPAPTTARFVLVVTSLLTAGLFLGTWLHNAGPVGQSWSEAVTACRQQTLPDPSDPAGGLGGLARTAEFAACTGPVENRRAVYSLAGLAAGALGALVLLYAAPVLIRRRRQLVEPNPKLDRARERFAEMATEAGVRPPRLAVGSTTVGDAFSFGTPGRYTVVLPKAVVIKLGKSQTYEPLIRHELAHISARDVPLAWTASSLWYAVATLLLVPVALAPVYGDASVLPDYLWRAALLTVVALLVSRATLRSREFDADLRAVARQPSGARPLVDLLRRSVRPPARRGWRQILSNHPDPLARARVVERPELAAAVTFLDGLVAAFLASLSAPLLVSHLTTVLAPLGGTDVANVLPFLLVGPLLGATVGLGLWRQALVARVTGGRPEVLPVALGIVVGLTVGQMASLANVALGWQPPHPGEFAAVTALALGGTYVVAGLGELWADASPRFRRSRAGWVGAVTMSSIIFALVLWMSESLRQAFELGGWLLASGVLFSAGGGLVPGVIALLLAAAVLWAVLAARRCTTAPSWLVEEGVADSWARPHRPLLGPTLLAGLLAGLVAALTVMGDRALAAESATPEGVFRYLAVAAAGAGGAALALTVLGGRRGPGLVLLAVPLGSLVAAAGLVVVGAASGGWTSALWGAVVRPTLGLGLIVALAVAGAALARPLFRGAPNAAIPAASALLAAAMSLWALVGGAVLTPFTDPSRLEADIAEIEGAIEALTYLDTIRPDAGSRYLDAAEETVRLTQDSSLDAGEVADRLTAGPIAQLSELAQDMADVAVHDAQVRAVHDELLAAVEAKLSSVEAIVAYARTGDQAYVEDYQRFQAQADAHVGAWNSGADELSKRSDEELD